MVPVETYIVALFHLCFFLGVILHRRPSLVFKAGEWHALLEIVESNGITVRHVATARHASGPHAGVSGGRWENRSGRRATYAIPLGTTDRVYAEQVLRLVKGDVEGPLPTAKLVVARDLWHGVLTAPR
jgi:hypothetical protein